MAYDVCHDWLTPRHPRLSMCVGTYAHQVWVTWKPASAARMSWVVKTALRQPDAAGPPIQRQWTDALTNDGAKPAVAKSPRILSKPRSTQVAICMVTR